MRQPTLKQQRFILAYLENGGNATQAALTAYNTNYATARVIGYENLTKPNVKREIDRLMRAEGLSPKDAVIALADALEATDTKDHPDHRTRLKAADLYLKLIGAFPDRQTKRGKGNQDMDEQRRQEVFRAAMEP